MLVTRDCEAYDADLSTGLRFGMKKKRKGSAMKVGAEHRDIADSSGNRLGTRPGRVAGLPMALPLDPSHTS